MRISICEDCKNDSLILKNYIEKYMNLTSIDYSIKLFFDGNSFISNFKKGCFDIIFLDIYLTDTMGIDLAKEIRKIDKDVHIIFTTFSPDYCLDGFEVNATHYLVKPILYEKISEALDRCKSVFCNSKKSIKVLSNKAEIKILINDIIFIEVYNNISTIHTIYGPIDTYIPLKNFESMLNIESFLKTHRSYLVNMKYIKEIKSDSFLLENTISIPIKQNGRKSIKNTYLDYIFTTEK